MESAGVSFTVFQTFTETFQVSSLMSPTTPSHVTEMAPDPIAMETGRFTFMASCVLVTGD